MENAAIVNRFERWRLKHRKAMNCLKCGIKFDYPANANNRKFCGKTCRWPQTEEHKRNIAEALKNSEKYKTALANRQYKPNAGQFGQRQYKGDIHWHWKGGVSPINERIRKSIEYEEWRTKVFERDLYTCQHCGQVGGALQADHIKPFAYYEDLRFELSNGRTLCVSCHRKTETYGYKVRVNHG